MRAPPPTVPSPPRPPRTTAVQSHVPPRGACCAADFNVLRRKQAVCPGGLF